MQRGLFVYLQQATTLTVHVHKTVQLSTVVGLFFGTEGHGSPNIGPRESVCVLFDAPAHSSPLALSSPGKTKRGVKTLQERAKRQGEQRKKCSSLDLKNTIKTTESARRALPSEW